MSSGQHLLDGGDVSDHAGHVRVERCASQVEGALGRSRYQHDLAAHVLGLEVGLDDLAHREGRDPAKRDLVVERHLAQAAHGHAELALGAVDEDRREAICAWARGDGADARGNRRATGESRAGEVDGGQGGAIAEEGQQLRRSNDTVIVGFGIEVAEPEAGLGDPGHGGADGGWVATGGQGMIQRMQPLGTVHPFEEDGGSHRRLDHLIEVPALLVSRAACAPSARFNSTKDCTVRPERRIDSARMRSASAPPAP